MPGAAGPNDQLQKARGKTFNARLAYYARVNDAGEVVEIRGYPDIAGVMGQLGVMGQPARWTAATEQTKS